MTCKELQELASSVEKERIDLELKSFKALVGADGTSPDNTKIAHELIALANTEGGKLIFGLKDDGSFEGALPATADDLKGKIYSLCRDRISPVLPCVVQVLACTEGEVLIVHVPKYTNIPHACIVSAGQMIKTRTYYVRTGHGKRLVEDAELAWLFRNRDEPSTAQLFRLGIELNKEFRVVGKPCPRGNLELAHFGAKLPAAEHQKMRSSSDALQGFFVELFPFLILKSIASYYKESWYIGIDREFEMTWSGPMKQEVSKTHLNVADIPRHGTMWLNQLDWDWPAVLETLFPTPIVVPDGTRVAIHYKAGQQASLVWEHPNYRISLLVGCRQAGAGLHPNSVSFEYNNAYARIHAQDQLWDHFSFFYGVAEIKPEYFFPGYEIDAYERHRHYFDTLTSLIREHWDYDMALKELPSLEMLLLTNKVDAMLHTMNQPD